MTPQLEKVFFKYILVNTRHFDIVLPHFFRNKEIKTVFEVIRKYMLINTEAQTPSARQIFDMIQLEDLSGSITKEILKSILETNLKDYDEKNFIEPKFNAWVLSNRIKTGAVDIIDETRNLENITNFEDAVEKANKIKSIIDEMSSTRFVNDDDDLGSDFDDPECHNQDTSNLKVKTGFDTIDHMLNGGWDSGSLNVIIAETSAGKSLWMQNFSVKAANNGSNVLYITLEMTEKKVMKRLGSMRLKIPINDYDKVSLDTEFIKRRIETLTEQSGNDLFDKKVGRIITKFYSAGSSTVNDFDDFIQKLKEKKGIKIDLIVVDYMSLITTPKGIGADNLYTKGKFIAEALRSLAAKWKCPLITATQVAKNAWNAMDITLESVPESKAIPETCDTMLAIIRTEEMKRTNKYRLKLLKQRDGDFSHSLIQLNLDPIHLTLGGDVFLDGF